jgi:hypothetical protein
MDCSMNVRRDGEGVSDNAGMSILRNKEHGVAHEWYCECRTCTTHDQRAEQPRLVGRHNK